MYKYEIYAAGNGETRNEKWNISIDEESGVLVFGSEQATFMNGITTTTTTTAAAAAEADRPRLSTTETKESK